MDDKPDAPKVQVDYILPGNHQISVMYHRVLESKSALVCVRDTRYPASTLFYPAFSPSMKISLPRENKEFNVMSIEVRFFDEDFEYLVLPFDRNVDKNEGDDS